MTGPSSIRFQSTGAYINEELVRHGYLGTAPLKPTVAISLHTLNAYRQLHRECPRLSIQAQVKALCHISRVSIWLFYAFPDYK